MVDLSVRTFSFELLLLSLTLLLLIFAILRYTLSFKQACTVALIKCALFFLYFSGLLGASWTHSDDITYLEHAFELSESYSLSELTFSLDGYISMMAISGGRHILYTWWNVLATEVFGHVYYAPIALNILVSALSGVIFFKIVRLEASLKYSQWCTVFFLTHLDMLTWSSLINVKGTLVVFLTLSLLYQTIVFFRGKNFTSLILILLILFMFLWIRFYIPVLYLVSVILLVLILYRSIFVMCVFSLISAVALVYIIPKVDFSLLNPFGFVSGAIRFLLTPQPWGIVDSYKYLFLSSFFNLFMFIPLLFGAYRVYRCSEVGKVIVVYFFVCLGLYSILPELQGPRHRYQFIPLIALAQFHFLFCVCKHAMKKIEKRAARNINDDGDASCVV
ncbi:hypothetical protein L1285_10910 [Pseudoalteromonas sp. DL2-H2.2]|uniref:hypothetical protein n=1 Tax=Pseudoalteromonas sp. DL2-H2.2 TaxID=2908889 RepID=UPI001F466382|nr:hypothetical protein [Pseudoalteromonas sp. DL2-H2.2]MCF2908828.1 hypothetical protein [Pseudoalteromonas sp. DL2-H2.2]